jgi:hypothetical protein
MDTVLVFAVSAVCLVVPFAFIGTVIGVAAIVILEAVEGSYYGGRK